MFCDNVTKIIEALEEMYPDAVCTLTYDKPHELLFSVRLAAQCTDERVNIVTKDLYKRYNTLSDFAYADISELSKLIFSCGFYNSKARDIIECAKVLINEYGGTIPQDLEKLCALPGVGRKTANLIMGDLYHKPSYVCDTHCIRIANRLGLSDSKDPYKTEMSLRNVIPPEKSGDFCHRLVHFGREICSARAPKCSQCILNARNICPTGADAGNSEAPKKAQT